MRKGRVYVWFCALALGCSTAIADNAVQMDEDGGYSLADGSAFVSVMKGGPGTQGLPAVAIVAAAAATPNVCQFTDPQAKLAATGRFSTVDIFNVVTGTPTLEFLQGYNAVMCWTNSTPQDTNAWGDVLADYIDGGGGVVSTVFAVSTTTTNRWIGGRYDTEDYEVIVPRSGNTSGATSLGTIHDPDHPVVQNVTTLSGTSLFRPTGVALHPDGVLLASWADGKILAAVRDINGVHRVDLGLYPPSADCSGAWWVGDGAVLMANALEWVGGGGATLCQYTLTKSKAKGGCLSCPSKGDNYGTEAACESIEDCSKKLKTTIACPNEAGTCKLKGKRSSCG